MRAQGEADAVAIQAEGQKRSAVIRVQGEAEAVRLLGEAQATSLRARGEAVAAYHPIVELVTAERWNGVLPQTLLNEKGFLPYIQSQCASASFSGAVDQDAVMAWVSV